MRLNAVRGQRPRKQTKRSPCEPYLTESLPFCGLRRNSGPPRSQHPPEAPTTRRGRAGEAHVEIAEYRGRPACKRRRRVLQPVPALGEQHPLFSSVGWYTDTEYPQPQRRHAHGHQVRRQLAIEVGERQWV